MSNERTVKISRVTVSFLCRHMAGHSSSNFVCQICKDVFDNQTLLNQHFLELHPTKTSHHCGTCNEDFISELFLQIHDTEYHSTPTEKLKQGAKSLVETKSHKQNDSINSKQFNNSGYLQRKVSNALAKTNDNLFWCPVCFESFSKRESLRGHFRSSHTFGSGSIYVCELCDIEKPSAEMLCWHLEVHSNNIFSVNRFSKLRTCFSVKKKEDTENCKQVSKIDSKFQTESDESTTKTQTKLNDPKRLKIKENVYAKLYSTKAARLNIGDPTHGKKVFWKENAVQKIAASRSKLSPKKQRILHSQRKLRLLGRSKLNLLSSKKLLLQVNTIAGQKMKDDEIEGNHFSEVISCSKTKMDSKTAKDKSLHEIEGYVGNNFQRNLKRHCKTICNNKIHTQNSTNHDNYDNGRSKRLDGESVLISDQLNCEDNTSLNFETTNNTIIDEVESSENATAAEYAKNIATVWSASNNSTLVESTINTVSSNNTTVIGLTEETENLCGQNEANAHLLCKEHGKSPSEGKTTELFVDSPVDSGENVSSNLMNKSMAETSFDVPEKQSVVIKSILSKKGKSRFRNLRSNCPTKPKNSYVINTKKSKLILTTHDSSNLMDNQKSYTKTMHESNLTAEHENSSVTKAKAEILNTPSNQSHLLPNIIQEKSQCVVKITLQSQSANNRCDEMSSKTHLEVLDSLINKNECQNIASNVSADYELKVPVSNTRKNSKNPSREASRDDLKNKMQATIGNNSKDLTTFLFEDKESKKNKSDLKSTVHGSLKETVINTIANFESDSLENGVFCGAVNAVSKTASKKTDSLEILREGRAKKSEKLVRFKDLQLTACGTPLICGNEENVQSQSAILVNSLQDQNYEPVDEGSSTLREVVTESTSLKSKSCKEDPNSDISRYEPNESFEEISCDKCSLKFYNQDDLFDHLGSHYNI